MWGRRGVSGCMRAERTTRGAHLGMVARSQRHAEGRADLKQEEQRPVAQQPYIVGIEEGGMPAPYSSEGRLDDRRRDGERRDEDKERNGMQHLEATKSPRREGRRLWVAVLVIFVMLSSLGHDGRCEVGGGGMKRLDEDEWMRKVGVPAATRMDLAEPWPTPPLGANVVTLPAFKTPKAACPQDYHKQRRGPKSSRQVLLSSSSSSSSSTASSPLYL